MKQKNGIFLLNKIANISSYKQITLLKNKLKIKKVGHCGTLDPFATGLLIVLVNDATKLSDFLITENKEYAFTSQFFIKTETGDITGKIINQQPPFIFSNSQLKNVLNHFNGLKYIQTVPLYSAVKVNGKKLYNYARNLKPVNLPKREVTINNIELTRYNSKTNEISFVVNCSKGTYVRALTEDIGNFLNAVATTKNLHRLKSGFFTINQSKNYNEITWDDLISLNDVIELLGIPVVNYDNSKHILNGQEIFLPKINFPQVFIKNSQVTALYQKKTVDSPTDKIYVCKRLVSFTLND